MAAYTYTLSENTTDAASNVLLEAGNYRVQDNQVTLLDGKEIHITVSRINVDTYKMDTITFIVSTPDLQAMSNAVTTGKAFSEELDDLIWGWLFAKQEGQLLLGRDALVDEVMPAATKVA